MTALTWYVARSAGIVAYLLLSTSVVVGVLMSARAKFTWPRFAVEEVHRFLAILTGVFLALHGIALLADRVVPISIVQLVIPFQTSYRPLGVGLGVTSALLLLAVALSNLVRKRLPFRFWRRIHYVTLAVWLTATAHGLLSGTDRQDFWFIALVGVAVCTRRARIPRALRAHGQRRRRRRRRGDRDRRGAGARLRAAAEAASQAGDGRRGARHRPFRRRSRAPSPRRS